MSGRGAKRRGRPPKTPTVDRQASKFQYHLLKKPKYLQNRAGGSDSQISTPTPSRASSPQDSESSRRSISRPSTSSRLTASRRSNRGAKRGTSSATPVSRGLNSSTYSKKGYESEYLYGSDFGDSSDENDGDDDLLTPSETDSLIGDHESESDFSLSSFSNGSSSKRTPRQPSPEPLWLQKKDLPQLELPESSDDLLVPLQYSMQTAAIYDVLRRFKYLVRLSPFRLEDFCAALLCEDQSALLTEIHIMLMKAILREEDSQATHFGPLDQKDSVNISVYLIDQITWPEVLRSYVESDASFDRHVLHVLSTKEYPYTGIDDRLTVLQFLTDQFLITTPVRENMLQEGPIHYDDHCRICHRLGDLLCCETCPSVFHLECVDPPLVDVPTEDWQCSICKTHQLSGVYDCISSQEKQGLLCRHEHIGFDRHGRKYWFVARRIFVETEDGTNYWYYSTEPQLELLLSKLDQNEMESILCRELLDLKDEIIRQMQITENLTTQNKGNKKSYLEIQNQNIEKSKTNENDEQTIEETTAAAKKAKEASNDKVASDTTNDSLMEEMIGINEDQDQIIDVESTNGKALTQPRKHVTRLKTGAISIRTFKQEETKRKRSNDDVDKLGVDGDTRLTRQKSNQVTTGTLLFRLGMENGFKTYSNQFSTNAYALNKPQRNEERDKKRHLSHKFSLTTASEFKWIGSFNGTQTNIITTIRQTLLALEQGLATPFLHPNWSSVRKIWLSAVAHSNTPANFAKVLVILQTCIKTPIFANVWHEQLGHHKLQRITSNEREEKKKIEKREKRERDDEEERNRLAVNFVKYSLGLKHQVWKQKGEEYRIHGQWGWIWMSYARRNLKLKSIQSQTTISAEKCMVKVEHGGASKILSVKPETAVALQSIQFADLTLAKIENTFESVDVSRALTAPGRLLYPKLAKKSKLDDLLARRIHLRDAEEQRLKALCNDPEAVLDEPPATTIINDKNTVSNIEKQLNEIANQSVVKAPELNIDKELVNSLAEKILATRVQFFQLNRFSKLYKCYNKECNKSDTNVFSLPQASLVTCYSPLCLQKARVRRDLLISLRKAHQANSETAAAIMNVVNSKKPSILKSKLTENQTEGDRKIDSAIIQKDIKDAVANAFDYNEFDVVECITLTKNVKTKVNDEPMDAETSRTGSTTAHDSVKVSEEDVKPAVELPNAVDSTVETEPKVSTVDASPAGKSQKLDDNADSLNAETANETIPKEPMIDTCLTVKRSKLDDDVDVTEGSPASDDEQDPMNQSLRARISPRKTRSAATSTTITNTVCTNTVTTSCIKSEFEDGTTETVCIKSNSTTKTQQTQYRAHPNRRFTTNTLKSMKKEETVAVAKEFGPDGITERVYTRCSSSQKIYLKKSLVDQRTASKNDKSAVIRVSGSKFPVICDFRTKNSTKSMMVLPKFELVKLARSGGKVPAYGFHPLAKTNMSVWPYPCSRPLFKTSWLFRTLNVKTFSAMALQLRIIWCCMKWDDMATKPPTSDGKHQVIFFKCMLNRHRL